MANFDALPVISALAIAVILALLILVIRERMRRPRWRVRYPYAPGNQADESYNFAHPERQVFEGVELATQRGTGRQLGGLKVVEWVPGQSQEVDQAARWLLEHGHCNGVEVVEVRHYSPTRAQ